MPKKHLPISHGKGPKVHDMWVKSGHNGRCVVSAAAHFDLKRGDTQNKHTVTDTLAPKKNRTKKIQQPCATPYRCAEARAILGDCSDRSRDFGRGCQGRPGTLCNNSESDPSNPRESPSLPRNGKRCIARAQKQPFQRGQTPKTISPGSQVASGCQKRPLSSCF